MSKKTEKKNKIIQKTPDKNDVISLKKDLVKLAIRKKINYELVTKRKGERGVQSTCFDFLVKIDPRDCRFFYM